MAFAIASLPNPKLLIVRGQVLRHACPFPWLAYPYGSGGRAASQSLLRDPRELDSRTTREVNT